MSKERHASFEIMHSRSTADTLLIRDCGPWDQFPTVTNDASHVVKALTDQGFLKAGMRLEYIDSLGNRDEIVHNGRGRFIGFITTAEHKRQIRLGFIDKALQC